MSFDDEMKAVASAETAGKYISEPCVEVVTLKSYKMSESDYKGCPYIEVVFETDNSEKAINTSRLYRVRDTDKPEVAEIKNKRIKELFENAEADFTLSGEQIIKSAIGKKVKALFKKSEYQGADAALNNKPIIKTKIEYSFSTNANSEITGNQSYFHTPLNPKALAKFNADMERWERDNPPGGVDTPIVADDPPTDNGSDLPF